MYETFDMWFTTTAPSSEPMVTYPCTFLQPLASLLTRQGAYPEGPEVAWRHCFDCQSVWLSACAAADDV